MATAQLKLITGSHRLRYRCNAVNKIAAVCTRALILLGVLSAALPANATSSDTYIDDLGATPSLPAPQSKLIPTIEIAKAVGWSEDAHPTAATGLAVNQFAAELDHPRWLYVLPNGDVLVAETNAPERPDDSKGIKGAVMKRAMTKAGANTPTANRITLLRDTNNDGRADEHSVFLQGLNSPFGMVLVGNYLYVANTDAVVRFPYETGATHITAAGEKLVDLPAGTINHHWTKNLIADRDGKHLYVTVGSNSNAGENGIDKEENRAAILEVIIDTRNVRVFASGLRNANGLAWNPDNGELWTVVNERDELGNHLVPDYMTSVKDGAFYGWPYSYFGQHVDDRVKPQRPDLVAQAIAPDYALGSHTASLGLTFYTGKLLPQHYLNGAFVAQHGSWNRDPPSGYKLVFVPFTNGKPSGMPEDILTGFLDDKGNAMGRPVGVVVDKQGALLLADDVGNRIWRVTLATTQ
jgi:glucose/arabinose dehydrogenase